MKLTIRYNDKARRSWRNLLLIFAVLAVIQIFANPHIWFFFAFYLLLAILAALNYYLYEKYQYITISGDRLRKNEMVPRAIRLSELTRIKKFAGDYTLYTPAKSLTINTEYIDKDSLKDLEAFLQGLPVEIEEIPVNRWLDLKAAK